MIIARLRLAANGRIEMHSEGPMCWYDDYKDLQHLLDEVTAAGERVLAVSEEMKRQLDEVTRERDLYKQMCALADALRNHERGMG